MTKAVREGGSPGIPMTAHRGGRLSVGGLVGGEVLVLAVFWGHTELTL